MTDSQLYNLLEEQFRIHHTPDFIPADPISIPHSFSKKQDIEIAAFLTATIAWGQRPVILKNARDLMSRMDQAPYEFIMRHEHKDLERFRNFTHRTFNGDDCLFFIRSLQYIYKTNSSLEFAFRGKDIFSSISSFRKTFFSIPHPSRVRKHISDPSSNSAAKRLNLFLRWMVRKDSNGIDFGIWKIIRPKDLLCPLDVHSARIARKLGLLTRKQNDWKSVFELTSRLRKFDPQDPVKYDFALFGIGVTEGN